MAAARRGEAPTFEALGSGTALARRAAVAGLPADGARVVELVRAGDPEATRVWDEVAFAMVTGVANLAYLFSPEAIVLGGGVGRNGDLLLPAIQGHVDDHGPPGLQIAVLVAALGDDSGLAGAGAWLRATRAVRHG